jgi:hypothetical protein
MGCHVTFVWAQLPMHVWDAIRFPNVIVWFGLGGHELRLAAGEKGVVLPFVSLPRRGWAPGGQKWGFSVGRSAPVAASSSSVRSPGSEDR